MTNKELACKKELCATLDLNFDEANELFSSETLNNMKMSQISGGHSSDSRVSCVAMTAISSSLVSYTVQYSGAILANRTASIMDNGDGTVSLEILYYKPGCTVPPGCDPSFNTMTYTTTMAKLMYGDHYCITTPVCPDPTSSCLG